MFREKSEEAPVYQTKLVTSTELGVTEWPAFLDALEGWLNNYVAPHNLKSISVFESETPNEKGTLNAAIVHNGIRSSEDAVSKPGNFGWAKEVYNYPSS